MRQGGNKRGETMMNQNRKDDATIRVSNLPESMSETDMQELCVPFGKIDRIFLAKDRYNNIIIGFLFV
jgi:translation initiation factor 3 subunit G